MNEDYRRFRYDPLIKIPEGFRRIGLLETECDDKSFREAEEAFDRLRQELSAFCGDDPFLNLHLLRMIKSRLLMLAVQKREPLSVCLEHLRARLDLEYSRDQIYGKAAQALVIANYSAECHEVEIAISILTDERTQLKETAKYCLSWITTITDRLRELGVDLQDNSDV